MTPLTDEIIRTVNKILRKRRVEFRVASVRYEGPLNRKTSTLHLDLAYEPKEKKRVRG